MSVAFEGIDRLVVTFLAGDVTAGKPVVMGGEGSVKNASSGQMPVGVALHARDGHAAVQLKGFVTVQYSGTTRPGAGPDGAGEPTAPVACGSQAAARAAGRAWR
ncbi:MAG: hypothetical protein ACLUNZ_00055 [Evtepia sp.]